MRYIRTVLRFGWPYLRRYWGRMLAGMLLGVLFGLSNASFLWATKEIFSRLDPEAQAAQVEKQAERSGIVKWAVGMKDSAKEKVDAIVDPWLPRRDRPADARQIIGGLMFLPILIGIRGILAYLSTYCTSWVSYRMVRDLRVDVLAKLHSLSLDYFHRSTTGDLLTRINNDTSALHRCLVLGLADLTKEPVTILILSLALCVASPKLAILVLVFVPLCIIPLSILGRKVRRANKGVVSSIVSQSSLLVEALTAIRVVKAFGLEAEQLGRYAEFNTQQVHHSMKITKAREMVNPLIEVISMIGLGIVVVVIFYSKTSIPDLVAFLTGVTMLFTPIKKLGAVHVLFKETSVGVDRLAQVLNETPSVKEAPAPRPLKEFKGGISVENLSFAYGDKPVLKGVNLDIPRGYKLGIAGESGCGKSTLVNLLFRFYDPTVGAIRIDGMDIRETSFSDLRHLMAFVSQEIVMFDQTVAGNIGLGREGATRGEIETAAKGAYAHDFIMKLEQGYDTRIVERGENLSVGQRQRIAIARAFVRNAPILVLDEATSALDSQSEAEVQAAIERLEQNRTVICVAHRLSTLRNMDRIIVLAEGQIVEEGSFEELVARGGLFAGMARRQGIEARENRAATTVAR